MKTKLLIAIVKSLRPQQWIKNLALYAALVFSGLFFNITADGTPYFVVVSYAFGIFCVLTSSIYLINDIVDVASDRKHPFKRKRPIASGALPIPLAWFLAITGLFTVFFLSLWLPFFFKVMALCYLALQVLYTTVLKHLAIWDVAAIATGFLIRIYAGAVVLDLHMSVWFLLTVISASLFLAVGKRQSERTLLLGQEVGTTRVSLKRYSQRLLDQYTGMFANATWLTYALFTFQREIIDPGDNLAQIYTFLPRTLQSQKLLMATIPLVIFGVMRYLQLVYEDNQGESPEKVLLRDKQLLATVFTFGAMVMVILYFLG